jgi:hypothetical protein
MQEQVAGLPMMMIRFCLSEGANSPTHLLHAFTHGRRQSVDDIFPLTIRFSLPIEAGESQYKRRYRVHLAR